MVIVGPGPIGLCATLVAALPGANPLVVVDIPADESRLALAKSLGATHVTSFPPEELLEQLRGLTDGYGPDLVVDSAGVSASLRVALDLVRPGGQVTKVGWGRQPYGSSVDRLVAKTVSLQGSFSHTWPTWQKGAPLIRHGPARPLTAGAVQRACGLYRHVGPRQALVPSVA